MQGEVVDLLIIVDVIDFNFKSLLLLKKIVNGDFGHKVRAKGVMNYLSLTNFNPVIALGFEKDQKRIRKTKRIKVGKIFAAEW